MVKRCCYGVCNTDSRYEDRLQDAFCQQNGPTEEYPDPIPFDGRTPKPARKVLTKRVIETPKAAPNRQVKRKLTYSETSEIQTPEIPPDSNRENIPPDSNKENTVAIQTEGGWADPIDILSLTVRKEILRETLQEKILEMKSLYYIMHPGNHRNFINKGKCQSFQQKTLPKIINF
ncbi:unnamed protein product [Mytilus coruscus]|uniref:Uncharacterized protein n=1 Tax=Mytilus coruscus TaxID=42192 RepID=A0A6J8BPX5_MYTCO|nr:unnamed protein product [Mytilus coruscus]